MSSLSNHERNQFNLLTDIFASDDPALARRMNRRAKATEMTCFGAEDVRMFAYGGLIVSIFIAFSAFFGQGNILNLLGGFILSLTCIQLILRYSGTDSFSQQREYSDN